MFITNKMCTRKMERNFSIDFNSNISRMVKQLFANYFVQENILQSKFKNKSNFPLFSNVFLWKKYSQICHSRPRSSKKFIWQYSSYFQSQFFYACLSQVKLGSNKLSWTRNNLTNPTEPWSCRCVRKLAIERSSVRIRIDGM